MRAPGRCVAHLAGLVLCTASAACTPSAGGAPATATVREQAGFDRRLPAFGGELLGSDRGEFVGELAFRSPGGEITPLLETNVRSLHETPTGFIAVTGLAHLSLNGGAIVSIARSGPHRLTVDKVTGLPGAPLATRQRADGSVAIKLFTGEFDAGGAGLIHTCVLFDAKRKLAPVECDPEWRAFLPWSAYECRRSGCGTGAS